MELAWWINAAGYIEASVWEVPLREQKSSSTIKRSINVSR
jgi:hypothetical protein